MTKYENVFIIRRDQVMNNNVEATPSAKRASYRHCILSAASAALFSVGSWAQTQLATVSGIITDPSGAVVPGASVTVANQGNGLKRSLLSGTAGAYRFVGLPTGDYSLRIKKTGFQSQIREGVELHSAAEVTINIQIGIGDLSQQATVSANTGIDSTTSSINGTLPQQNLAELPLNSRDLLTAVALEPRVAPNPSSAPSLLSSGRVGKWQLTAYARV